MRTKFKNFMFKMGSQLEKSWQQFILGLTIFAAGVGLILLGTQSQKHLLQLPGIALLGCGAFFAGKGYLGIFANRFSQVLNQAASFDSQDDKNNHLK